MSSTVVNSMLPSPAHDDLVQALKGKHLHDIQTPHLVIDRGIYIKNCEKMKNAVERLGWDFRAHIKTHKTAEGTKLQCQKTGTSRIIVSTLPEAWIVINAGLIADGTVTDVGSATKFTDEQHADYTLAQMLYSMPPSMKLLEPLRRIKAELDKHGATFRLMIDNPAQIKGLEAGLKAAGEQDQVWSIYLKLDIGSKRAGLPPTSDSMATLIRTALSSPNVSAFGTYTHANFSYASKDAMRATEILAQEVAAANDAAKLVLSIADELGSSVAERVEKNGLRLAVGATPTAHAAGPEWEAERKKAGVASGDLVGSVELHAGNYCLLDTQQCATSLVDFKACAMYVGSTVISTYPDRGEALCDAGAICMSKDVGPIPGYGPVISPSSLQGWHLNRTSQEHGILGKEEGKNPTGEPKIEQYVSIVPQHACLTAAQHPWYLIVDGSDVVEDVWIPCRGW